MTYPSKANDVGNTRRKRLQRSRQALNFLVDSGYALVLLTGEPGEIPGRDGQKQFTFDWSAEPGPIGNAQKTVQIHKIAA